MKKYLILLISTLVFLLMLEDTYAISIKAGANVWYAWYEPGFKTQLMGENESTTWDNNFEMIEPAEFVYGGLLALNLSERISIGGVFSYGAGWKCKSNYYNNPTGTEIHMFKSINKIERLETDISISYSLSSVFGVFFGWKYLDEHGEGTYYYFPLSMSSQILIGEFDINFYSTGPGVGLSATINIAKNLYLISSITGIYQVSRVTVDITGISRIQESKKEEQTDKYLGGSLSMNMAYVIPDTSVTLSLGGRYQRLNSLKEQNKRILFYGILISAIYSFNI